MVRCNKMKVGKPDITDFFEGRGGGCGAILFILEFSSLELSVLGGTELAGVRHPSYLSRTHP